MGQDNLSGIGGGPASEIWVKLTRGLRSMNARDFKHVFFLPDMVYCNIAHIFNNLFRDLRQSFDFYFLVKIQL